MGVHRHSREGWLEFAGCRVRSIEFGGGRQADTVAVFLHGRFGDASRWNEVVAGLEGAARCICVDLPGFGSSYSIYQEGLSLVQAAGLVEQVVAGIPSDAKVVLVGHDIGGTVALISAIRLATRLSGLILIGAACLTCPPPRLRPGFLTRWRLPSTIRPNGSRLAALGALEQSWPRHYERLSWKRAIPSITCPALLLWGSESGLDPDGGTRQLLRLLPNAELRTHPTASQWLPLESPAWVSSRLREFFFEAARSVPISDRKSLSR